LLVLDEALNLIAKFDPEYLLVAAGLDTFKDDPFSDLAITSEGIIGIGRRIASLDLPTTLILEGGYHIDSLGENIAGLLTAFANI
jgi:acetoin utilization deacetylase AcuC-like enzyme